MKLGKGQGGAMYHVFYMMHDYPIESQGVGRLERFRSDYLQFTLPNSRDKAGDVFQYILKYLGAKIEGAFAYEAQN